MSGRPGPSAIVNCWRSPSSIRRELAQRFSWQPKGDWEIRVYPDVDTFRNATGEPGWVAAHSRGLRIDMQPQAGPAA